jgi:hypothetical protein
MRMGGEFLREAELGSADYRGRLSPQESVF